MSFTAENGPVTFDIDDTDVYEYEVDKRTVS